MAPTDLQFLQAPGICIGSNFNLYCSFDIDSRRYTFLRQSPPAELFPDFRSHVTLQVLDGDVNALSGSYHFVNSYVGPVSIDLHPFDGSGGQHRQFSIKGPLNIEFPARAMVHGIGTWSYE